MPKARNTSPKAAVQRYKGGMFQYDSDEGVNKDVVYGMSNSAYKATNLDKGKSAAGPGGPFRAKVGSHPGAPWGWDSRQLDSDEGVNLRNYGAERTHDYKSGNVSDVKGAKVSPSKMPAKVGGGHSRKHQG